MMKIAIIEDHTFVGQTLQLCLQHKYADADIKKFVCGEDFFAEITRQKNDWLPEVILSDLLLKGLSGIDLVKKYAALKRSAGNDIRIIVLSSINEVETVRQVIKSGADGYLTKEATVEEIYEAIAKVMVGQNFIMARLKDSFISNILSEDKISLHLSPQQQALLKEICNGKTVHEASDALNLSINTARSYLQTIMRKFNVNRTPDLILFAIKNGLHQV